MSATSSTSSSTAADALAMSGLASGIDWTSIVNEMLTEEAAPETQMNTEETADENKKTAYQTIGTDLTTLNTDATTLSNPSFFSSRTTSVSDSSIASATAASGTALGNYTFYVKTLASDSVQQGSTASAPLSSTDNVDNLVLSSAGFATPVTAGTITVNGQTITISTSDTLQDVFNNIYTATGTARSPARSPPVTNPLTIRARAMRSRCPAAVPLLWAATRTPAIFYRLRNSITMAPTP